MGEVELRESDLPTEITVGGRTYEILSCPKKGEDCVRGEMMIEWAKERCANLGEEDGRHFLKHQHDIPAVLRGLSFVFPDWRDPDGRIMGAVFTGRYWWPIKGWPSGKWSSYVRFLRRKDV